MAILGGPLNMGNVTPGTQLILLCADGVTQVIYTVPSTCPMFSDLPDGCHHSLAGIVPPSYP